MSNLLMSVVLPSGTKVDASDKGYTIQAHTLKGALEVDRFSSAGCDPYTNLQRGVIVAKDIDERRI